MDEGQKHTECAGSEYKEGRPNERRDKYRMGRHNFYLTDSTVTYHLVSGQLYLICVRDIDVLFYQLCGRRSAYMSV